MDVLGLTVEFWNIYNEIYTPLIFNTRRLDGDPYAIFQRCIRTKFQR